jgi:hypothetical protein
MEHFLKVDPYADFKVYSFFASANLERFVTSRNIRHSITGND